MSNVEDVYSTKSPRTLRQETYQNSGNRNRNLTNSSLEPDLDLANKPPHTATIMRTGKYTTREN